MIPALLGIMLSFLLYIDSGFCHSMPCSAIDFKDAHTLNRAVNSGLIRRIEAIKGHNVRNVPRFVLTSGGSHHVGTFKSDDGTV